MRIVSRQLRAAVVVAVAATLGCGGRTTLRDRDGGSGSSSPTRDGGEGGGACTGGGPVFSPTGFPAALLHYAFDGDAHNAGTLGAAYDGLLDSTSFDAGFAGQAVVVQPPALVELPGTAWPLSSSGAMTIAFWFQEDGAPALNTALLDCRSGADGFHVYRGVYADSLSLCWGAGDTSIGPGGCAPFSLEAGGWHHLSIERSSPTGDLEVWLDASPVATLPTSGVDVFGSTTNDIFLGAAHVGELDGNGRVRFDEVRVYDRTLDDAQRCTELGGPWCGDCEE